MPHDLKFQILVDSLSAFILARVITESNVLTPLRIRIDGLYQRFMAKLGYATVFSPSTCHLCVGFWTTVPFHQPSLFLPTYSLSYIIHAFLKKYEIRK